MLTRNGGGGTWCMYRKIESLKEITKIGLNTHRYFIPNSYAEYRGLLRSLGVCTVRTDHSNKTKDLPFYVVNIHETEMEQVEFIWSDSIKNEYKLIISDGIKYDNIKEYNIVVKFNRNGDFIFDASELKVPLRHMYRYPLLSASGNIADSVSQWDVIHNKIGVNKLSIKKDLEIMYTYGVYNRWLEATKYPKEVGINKENIVLWQIA